MVITQSYPSGVSYLVNSHSAKYDTLICIPVTYWDAHHEQVPNGIEVWSNSMAAQLWDNSSS